MPDGMNPHLLLVGSDGIVQMIARTRHQQAPHARNLRASIAHTYKWHAGKLLNRCFKFVAKPLGSFEAIRPPPLHDLLCLLPRLR